MATKKTALRSGEQQRHGRSVMRLRRAVRAQSSGADAPLRLDEPAPFRGDENPETDLAPTILSHPVADRPPVEAAQHRQPWTTLPASAGRVTRAFARSATPNPSLPRICIKVRVATFVAA